jgi:aspartate aminotransferase/aminotransferase
MPDANPSVATQAPNPMFRIANLVHGRSDVIHLELGEPDSPTPPHIVEAASRSLRDERQGYGPGSGIPELREAIAARVARVNDFAPSAHQVVVAAGGTGALMAALLTLCVPGDEVLVPDPAWAGYDAMLAASGTHRARYPLPPDTGWLPDIDALEAAITPRSRVLLLNSPANPTGAVFDRETLLALVALAERHDLWILSDECYDEIVFEGAHLSPAALGAAERTITVGTCSKSYAMTGWRVGWAVAPAHIAGALGLVVAAQINNLPLFAQRAAQAALTSPQNCVRAMVATYHRRRDLAVALLRGHGLLESTPAGAFYLLVPAARAAGLVPDDAFDGVAFAERLILQANIAVAPGVAFGPAAARHVRVSLASSDDDLRAGLAGVLQHAASCARP